MFTVTILLLLSSSKGVAMTLLSDSSRSEIPVEVQELRDTPHHAATLEEFG